MKRATREWAAGMPWRTKGSRRAWWTRAGCALVVTVLALMANPGAQAQSSLRLAVVVNPAVPVKVLAAAELASVFSRSTRNWKDGSAVRALNLPPGSAERVTFDRVVLHMEPEQSAQFWVDRMVRGEEAAPKAVAKADIVLRLVATMTGAIAYVPEDICYSAGLNLYFTATAMLKMQYAEQTFSKDENGQQTMHFATTRLVLVF